MAGVCTRIALGALAAAAVVLGLASPSWAATWRSCRVATGAECATLRVPLDRSGATSGTVGLKLDRLPTDAARAAADGRLPRRRLRPARDGQLRPAALPGARARPAAAQRLRRRGVRPA